MRLRLRLLPLPLLLCLSLLVLLLAMAEAFSGAVAGGGAAAAASAGSGTCSGPTHLAVLVHGYVGTPEDLSYLKEAITKFGQGKVLAYTPSCNRGRTKDGVRAGGERVAEEVRAVVQQHPSLQDISFVGNSLGGLYSRYALSLLWDPEAKTIAGLRPVSFLTVATPHLGVRRFLAFPVPRRLHFTAPLFLGQTGNDLFLRPTDPGETAPLLLRMTLDDKYMAPLAAFKHRRAYGNVKEDLLVPYGTALFTPLSVVGDHWSFKEKLVVPDPETAHATLEIYHLPPVTTVEEEEGGVTFGTVAGALMSNGDGGDKGGDWMEHMMAQRLDGVGWEKIAVSFHFPLLQAHNKICALSRNPVLAYLYRQGRGVMDHCAQLVVDG